MTEDGDRLVRRRGLFRSMLGSVFGGAAEPAPPPPPAMKPAPPARAPEPVRRWGMEPEEVRGTPTRGGDGGGNEDGGGRAGGEGVLSTSDGASVRDAAWEDVEAALRRFDEKAPEIVLLEWTEDESVQVAGSRDTLTVEVRWREGGVPRHCVLGVAGRGDAAGEVVVWGPGGFFEVREPQVLTRAEAKEIVRHYFNERVPHPGYEATAARG